MTVILLYSLLNQEQLKDGDHDYPPIAHVVGYLISCLGLAQLPIFAVYAICKQKDESSIWMVTQIQLLFAFHKFFLFVENQKCIPTDSFVGSTRRCLKLKV